jgi:hypothetical protein
MRARAILAALVAIAVFAAAPATAGQRKKPPPLNVANRGESFKAAIGTYSWCYSQGDGTTCVVADAAYPPKSGKALPVRAGDKIVLRPHAKVESMSATTYDFDEYPNQPQRVEGKPRVWTLKVAKGTGKRKNLLLGVQYAGGENSAQFGFGIRRDENPPAIP